MVVKNLKELERELRTRIDYALLTDVTEVVTTVMLDHIERMFTIVMYHMNM